MSSLLKSTWKNHTRVCVKSFQGGLSLLNITLQAWTRLLSFNCNSVHSVIVIWDIKFSCSTWLLLENQVQWGYQDSSDNSPMTRDIPKNPAQHVFSKQDLNWRKIEIVVPTLALSVTKVSDVNSSWKKRRNKRRWTSGEGIARSDH